MLARASTKTFVSRVRKTAGKIFVSRKISQQGHSLAEVSLYIYQNIVILKKMLNTVFISIIQVGVYFTVSLLLQLVQFLIDL